MLRRHLVEYSYWCEQLRSSVFCKIEVPVQSKDGLPPEEDERGLVQTLDSVVDERDRVSKSTEKVNDEEGYLRFRGLDVLRILILALVIAEKQLTRCCRICILARKDYFDTKLD